jgi:hypothetical protein
MQLCVLDGRACFPQYLTNEALNNPSKPNRCQHLICYSTTRAGGKQQDRRALGLYEGVEPMPERWTLVCKDMGGLEALIKDISSRSKSATTGRGNKAVSAQAKANNAELLSELEGTYVQHTYIHS